MDEENQVWENSDFREKKKSTKDKKAESKSSNKTDKAPARDRPMVKKMKVPKSSVPSSIAARILLSLRDDSPSEDGEDDESPKSASSVYFGIGKGQVGSEKDDLKLRPTDSQDPGASGKEDKLAEWVRDGEKVASGPIDGLSDMAAFEIITDYDKRRKKRDLLGSVCVGLGIVLFVTLWALFVNQVLDVNSIHVFTQESLWLLASAGFFFTFGVYMVLTRPKFQWAE